MEEKVQGLCLTGETSIERVRARVIVIAKKNVTEAMNESMKTYNEEKMMHNEEEIYKQVLEASKADEDEILKKVMEESKKEANLDFGFQSQEGDDSLPPIQQVANMGYPMELVLQAYAAVGDDVPTMISYIYKLLN